MPSNVKSFSNKWTKFPRLVITLTQTASTKKTEATLQPVSGKLYHEFNITVNSQAMNSFIYLGSILSSTATIDSVINFRISKVCFSCGGLSQMIEKDDALS